MNRNIYASDRRKYETDKRRYHAGSDSDDDYEYRRQTSNKFPGYRRTNDKNRNATEKHHSLYEMPHSSREEFEDRPHTPPPPTISFELQRSNKPCRRRTARIFERRHRYSDDSPPPTLRFANDDGHDIRYRNERLIAPRNTNEFLNTLESSQFLNEDEMLRKLISDIKTPEMEQDTPGKIVLAVFDEGDNDEVLNKVTWRQVESSLCKVYLNIMRDNPGPPPVCRYVGSFFGCAILIECADVRSLRLFTQAINRVGAVWPGAKLRVVNPNNIPASEYRLRASATVPIEPSTGKAILECIKLSNPDIQTYNWRVVNVGAPNRQTNERIIVVSFNIASFDAIRERDGIIGYGINSIKLKINKRDLSRLKRSKGESRDLSKSIPINIRKRSWTETAHVIDHNSDDAILISDSEDEYCN